MNAYLIGAMVIHYDFSNLTVLNKTRIDLPNPAWLDWRIIEFGGRGLIGS